MSLILTNDFSLKKRGTIIKETRHRRCRLNNLSQLSAAIYHLLTGHFILPKRGKGGEAGVVSHQELCRFKRVQEENDQQATAELKGMN